jgi:hypothetical protein
VVEGVAISAGLIPGRAGDLRVFVSRAGPPRPVGLRDVAAERIAGFLVRSRIDST